MIKGSERTSGRLFVPDLTFGEHIEIEENIFFYMDGRDAKMLLHLPAGRTGGKKYLTESRCLQRSRSSIDSGFYRKSASKTLLPSQVSPDRQHNLQIISNNSSNKQAKST